MLGDVHPLIGVVGDEDPVGALLPRLVRVLGGRGDDDAVVEGHNGLGLAVNPQEEALAAPAYQTRPEKITMHVGLSFSELKCLGDSRHLA